MIDFFVVLMDLFALDFTSTTPAILGSLNFFILVVIGVCFEFEFGVLGAIPGCSTIARFQFALALKYH